MAKNKTTARPASKSEVYQQLAEATGLTKKQISSVFEELTNLIRRDIGKKGSGVFAVPGLLKIKRQYKEAQAPRQVRNPQTGEMMMSKPKPAHYRVKVLALKGLKEMVQ